MTEYIQPPSGGCVLKRASAWQSLKKVGPAAFGRLCVETIWRALVVVDTAQPPSGGCVLKPLSVRWLNRIPRQPPSGGCVLKHMQPLNVQARQTSRLRAAVC